MNVRRDADGTELLGEATGRGNFAAPWFEDSRTDASRLSMDADTTFIERYLTVLAVSVGALFLGLVLVQVQSALWAPLQKMFLGF